MRTALRSAVVLATAFLAAVPAPAITQAETPTLRVFNWADYIDHGVLSDFTKATGIKVVYDTYESNDVLEAMLISGEIGHDVVFPSGNFLARQIKAGIFQPLDRSRLPNWKNLDPDIMWRLRKYDRWNKYGAPYLWGTTGIAYNVAMVQQRMPSASMDSWSIIFDPGKLKLFADCGVSMLDAADEGIPAALKYLGEDTDSKDVAVLAKAETVLMGIRPYIRSFDTSSIDALANGDICLAVMWSGDAKIAANRAKDAGKGMSVEYSIPKEGAQMWFDLMAIPASAENPAAAHAFINYLLDPKVIAKTTNFVTYANANKEAAPFTDGAILNDPTIYPQPDVMRKLFLITPYDDKALRAVTKVWLSFKAS